MITCDICIKEIEAGYNFDYKKTIYALDSHLCGDCWTIIESYEGGLQGRFHIELEQKMKVFIEKLKKEKNEDTSD